MIKKINIFYNDVEHKILTTKCVSTDLFEKDEIRQVIEDLIDTATANSGRCVGLSANQIWDNVHKPAPKIFIMADSKGWKVFMDPIIKGSGKKIKTDEGCMSFTNPEKTKPHKRDKNVAIAFSDIDRNVTVEKYPYPNSMIIQHEMDHMDGKVI